MDFCDTSEQEAHEDSQVPPNRVLALLVSIHCDEERNLLRTLILDLKHPEHWMSCQSQPLPYYWETILMGNEADGVAAQLGSELENLCSILVQYFVSFQ